MRLTLEICFWSFAALVAYAYFVYPAMLVVLARLRSRPVRRGPFHGSASFVMAAFNEQGRVASRRDELVALLDSAKIDGDVVIVSDGSTDGTAAAARAGASPRVKVVELPQNAGKAACLTRGATEVTSDVMVFADARQRWAADALPLLLENFNDPSVGGATGDLCLETADGAVAGVGMYWKYEKAIRRLEGQIDSTIGATGAICAVRRERFHGIPTGTILDDVYWPMRVVLDGHRVVHDSRAQAFDRLPTNPRDEFRRKVRTLAGNFQLVARCPALLAPWRNRLWIQFASHKLARLAVPWLVIGMLVTSALLGDSMFYRLALIAQLIGLLVGCAGLHPAVASRSRLASVGASFLVLNAAAWVGFWTWAFGRAGRSWHKVVYTAAPATVTPETKGPSAVPLGCAALVLAGLAVALAPSQARAAEGGGQVYVVSSDGNDGATGTTDAPFKTLQRAADVVQPGDTVLVKAGTYGGMNFYRGIGGTADHPIRFQAGPNVIINTAAKTGPNPNSGINLEPGRGWFVFTGFHIVNSDGSMERACIRVTGNSHTQVLNNLCEKGGNWGVFASTSDDLLIEGNTCHDSPGQHGIYVSRGSKRATIRGNTLSGNHWDGLHLNGGAEGPIDHCLIENNVIFGNELAGIDGDGVQNSIFRNNVVYENGKHAVSLYQHDTATGSYHNVLVNNTFLSHSMFVIQMQPGSTANNVYNNILLHTGGGAYGTVGVFKGAPGLVSDYNVVSDRFSADLGVNRFGIEQWRKMTGQEAHSLLAASPDTLFVDAAHHDYHLRPGCPAVRAGSGDVAADASPAKDIEGKVRSKDHGWAAGAYN